MKKIYIVTSGWYSGYGIEGVFSTRELAEQFTLMFPDRDDRIEEYLLDPCDSEGKSCRKLFFVRIKRSGEVDEVEETKECVRSLVPSDIHLGYKNAHMNVYCFAIDEQHAIKIANEKRGEWIAMNKWPES